MINNHDFWGCLDLQKYYFSPVLKILFLLDYKFLDDSCFKGGYSDQVSSANIHLFF